MLTSALLDGTLDVVVDARLAEPPRHAALVDGDARLVRHLDAAPLDGVELKGRPRPVFGDRAVLQRDPATGAEEAGEELAQHLPAADPVLAARRLAEATVVLERGGDAIRVARTERRLVLADDVGLPDVRVAREEWRPDDVMSEQRPLAVIHADS